MATKIIELAGVGPVTLVKRAGSRSLRLSVSGGNARVSMPRWTPFAAGEAFAQKHAQWIADELAKTTQALLEPGKRIGKVHTLRFEPGVSAGSRITSTAILIKLAPGETSESPSAQKRAHAAAIRALRREASTLLPPRLKILAERHGKTYTSVAIKQLKRRWGSCDAHQNIVLNLYLMELPWDYIDYVLLHELTHTVHMNHGEAFWTELTRMNPRARDLAKQVRKHQVGVQ